MDSVDSSLVLVDGDFLPWCFMKKSSDMKILTYSSVSQLIDKYFVALCSNAWTTSCAHDQLNELS